MLKLNTPFRFEEALVQALVGYLNESLEPNAYILRELKSPSSLADVAIVRMRSDWHEHTALAEIPPRWVAALRHLPYRRTFNLHNLMEISNSGENTARLMLETFCALKYCKKSKARSTWIKNRQPIMAVLSIDAYEAKLKNWQRAIDQALRYRAYAERVWVVMDDTRAKAAYKALGTFEKYGVGFMTLRSKPNTVTPAYIFFEAQKNPPISAARMWHMNAEVIRRLVRELPNS